jgi:ubiquinol-cytochrome c reductase cytochrome b subunit
MKLLDWIEDRSGYRALVRVALDEPIPGGARAGYVFGSVLLFLFANQATTGLLLAMGYAPSVHDAWASVAYTQEIATLGWFIRGLHSAGASAMIVVLALHLLQVVWAGAYRKPRELTWWVGLALLGVVLAFSLSGYLLPWDQKGYFATQVATSLLGATPGIGTAAREIVQGGASYGNLTLTRFYALHVILLPATIVALIAAHIALFSKNGVTPPTGQENAPTETFYPRQIALDLLAASICAFVLVAWVLRTHGASLEAPADPSSSYEARPEWYFLPLFQLLRFLPGSLETAGALGVPLVAVGLLVALPRMTRSAALSVVALILGGAIGLGAYAKHADARDPAFVAGRDRAERAAEAARLRFRGKLGALAPSDRLALAKALFDDECASCHRLDHGSDRAPPLAHWSSRAWIEAFLESPDSYFGRTDIHAMKPVTKAMVDGEDRAALVEWIWAQAGAEGADAARVTRGQTLFAQLSCGDCHETDGTSDGHGIPNLGGRGSAAWLRAFIADAGAPRFFGKKNGMPRFADKLTDEEIDALVDLVRQERLR